MASSIARRGSVRVVLHDDCHEGFDGEYDSTNPGDIPLLRFDVDIKKSGKWSAIDDASYCTQIDARVSPSERRRLASIILNKVHDPASSGHSIKKLCERLSWINPSWGTTSERQGWVLG